MKKISLLSYYRARGLSQNLEDYLKGIYALGGEREYVEITKLANLLGVKPSSATQAVQKLEKLKLLEYRKYRGVMLKEAGVKVALELLRHHRLIELHLSRFLNVPIEKIHSEAEVLEHFISEDLETYLERNLDLPTRDPHGDPIPTKDGEVIPLPETSLGDLDEGEYAYIHKIPGYNQEMTRFLVEKGLIPGKLVKIEGIDLFEGPIILKIDNEIHFISKKIAKEIRVLRLPSNIRKIIRLDEMDEETEGVIVDMAPPQDLLKKFLSFGFTIGNSIKMRIKGFGGDPIEVEINGITISLRKHEAQYIKVALT